MARKHSRKTSRAPEYVRPPRRWSDVEGWNRYWSAELAEPWSLGVFDYLGIRGFLTHHPLVKERRGQNARFLCAGNGVSLEPYALAHTGLQVTVLDVSSVACDFVAQNIPSPALMAEFFPEKEHHGKTMVEVEQPPLDIRLPTGVQPQPRRYRTNAVFHLEKSRARAAQEHQPGGSVAILQEDLFRHRPERPYQFISSCRAYQGFPSTKRARLAKLFFQWLSPGGICFVEMINLLSNQATFEAPFLEAGFFEEDPDLHQWLEEGMRETSAVRGLPEREERREALWKALEERKARTQEQAALRRAAGEKMVVFLHGSG